MNILFAVGLLTCVYMAHYEYPAVFDEPAVVGWVRQTRPPPEPEFKSETGSSHRRHPESNLGTGIPREALNPNQPLDIAIERDGQVPTKTIIPEALVDQMGSAGWGPKEPSFPITDLESGMPAEKARNEAGRRDYRCGRQADRRPRRHDRKPEAYPGQANPDHGQAQWPALNFTVQPVLSDVTRRSTLPRWHRKRSHEGLVVALCGRISALGGQNKQGSLLILELSRK